ncbi:hypothetical protein CDD83_5105 [Cordyceps sp. RAO-2017]|nr:hypothetical protein CDD83_5105 [Cordyceps sp. RAO-2017]
MRRPRQAGTARASAASQPQQPRPGRRRRRQQQARQHLESATATAHSPQPTATMRARARAPERYLIQCPPPPGPGPSAQRQTCTRAKRWRHFPSTSPGSLSSSRARASPSALPGRPAGEWAASQPGKHLARARQRAWPSRKATTLPSDPPFTPPLPLPTASKEVLAEPGYWDGQGTIHGSLLLAGPA